MRYDFLEKRRKLVGHITWVQVSTGYPMWGNPSKNVGGEIALRTGQLCPSNRNLR